MNGDRPRFAKTTYAELDTSGFTLEYCLPNSNCQLKDKETAKARDFSVLVKETNDKSGQSYF